MGRPNVNWNVGIAAEKQSTYTSKAVKAGIPFASQVTEPNTKYIIKYDFSLGGEDVTIPEDCILEFDGGSLNGDKIHTLTLNGASIVSKGGVIFRNVVIKREPGLELYTSWFEWNDNNSNEQLVSIVDSVGDYGILHVDNIITLRNPIVLPICTSTTITGSIPNRVTAKKYGIKFIYSGNAENGLINWAQEACCFENMSFTHEAEDGTSTWNTPISLFKLDTRSETAADLDISFNQCVLMQQSYNPVILAYGRGLKVQNCLFHRGTDNGNKSTIVLEGKGSQSGNWLDSKIAGRGVFITNNRIHGNGGAPILELKQHPDDDDWTYRNIMITNNLCDLGSHLFVSSSKVIGVLIDGNTFIKKGPYANLIKIDNTAEQVTFSNNIINKNEYVDSRDSNAALIGVETVEGMTVKGIRICNNELQCKMNMMVYVTGTYGSEDVPIQDIQINGNRCSTGYIVNSVVPICNLQISDNMFDIGLGGSLSPVKINANSKNVVFSNNVVNGEHSTFTAIVYSYCEEYSILDGVNISNNIINLAVNMLLLFGTEGNICPICKNIIIADNILEEKVFTSTSSMHKAIAVISAADVENMQVVGNISVNDAESVLKRIEASGNNTTSNVTIMNNIGISERIGGLTGDTRENVELDYNHGTSRPTLDETKVGFCFYDESLTPARPIWWTGEDWVDATGTIV